MATTNQTQETPPLPLDAAEQLLRQLAPDAWNTDEDACRKLIGAVGALPLAVELLGGFLAAPDYTEFPELAREGLAELENPSRRLALAQQGLGNAHGQAQSLEATIMLSLTSLPQSSKDAFHSLGALAPLPADFEREAALAVSGGTLRDIVLLRNRSLLMRGNGDERYALHQVTAAVAAKATPPDAITRHRQHYLDLVNANRDDYQRIEAEYPQLRHAWQQMEDTNDDLGRFNDALDKYQHRRGLWAEQEEWLLRSMAQHRARKDQWGEAATLNNLGNVYKSQGRWDEAIAMYEQSLAIKRTLGDRHSEGQTLDNLGNVYKSQGRWDEAIAMYEQSLAIRRSIGDRHNEGHTLNNLGSVYWSQGQWDAAIAMGEQALAIFRSIGDRNSEVTTIGNLALVYKSQKRWDETIAMYKQALTIERALGDRHSEGQTLNTLGIVYGSQGRRNEAITMFEQSLAICRSLGDRHGEGQTLNNLGFVYQSQERWDEAIAMYEQSLTIERCLGDRHGEDKTLNNLAFVYWSQGRWDDAIAMYEQSLAIVRSLGDRHGEGQTLKNLGILHDAQGKKEQACLFWRQAIERLHPQSTEYQTVKAWVDTECSDQA